MLSLFQVLFFEQNVDIYAKMVCRFVFRCIDSLFAMQSLRKKCPCSYSLSLCIKSEYRKIWSRITPNTDTLYAVNVISWAKLLFMFSIDYHHLKGKYSTIKQHEMEIEVYHQRAMWAFLENYFFLLNNIVILTWWTQFNWLIVEEPMINSFEIIFILFL